MICVSHNGEVREVKYDGDLNTIYKEGGYEHFDIVLLRHRLVMFVDYEGWYKDGWENRVNWKAIYLRLNQCMERSKDAWDVFNTRPPLIVGNVCILAIDAKGRSAEPSEEQRKFILELLGEEVA